jgi:hypothetical protein
MSRNRTAKGIVLVPCLLLGGAFLSAAAWGDEQSNQVLALMIGLGVVGAGLLAQFIPTPPPEKDEAQG